MKRHQLFFLLWAGLYWQCANPNMPNGVRQTAAVKTGIEVLKERNFEMLKGKRVGLVTNPTGVDSQLNSTIDILYEAAEVNLVALYGPEHGVRGNYSAGEYVQNYTDSLTNLPVYSLYGKQRKPTAEMLKGVETLVYDIQDIGCRSYTYISTMGLVMEAASELGIEVIVLDRPNPLGGERVEGGLVAPDFISFVSQYPIPYLYGLTCGELAVMLNKEQMLATSKPCNLTVVPMEGWRRSMQFQDTGLPWVPTSPHIPHAYSAHFYPVSGILGELPAFSIGVGYTLPFQTFAAEWVTDPQAFAQQLNALGLPGVRFRPISYKPYYGTSQGKEVQGVQVHITDYTTAPLSQIQFRVLEVNHRLYPSENPFEGQPENRLKMFDRVCGSDTIRKAFAKNFQFADIEMLWTREAELFKQQSRQYYLYP